MTIKAMMTLILIDSENQIFNSLIFIFNIKLNQHQIPPYLSWSFLIMIRWKSIESFQNTTITINRQTMEMRDIQVEKIWTEFSRGSSDLLYEVMLNQNKSYKKDEKSAITRWRNVCFFI